MERRLNSRDDLVGLVGLSFMGVQMARRILAAGRSLIGYDPIFENMEPIAALGAQIARSAAEVAERASIVVCAADTDESARELILGSNGLAATAQHGDLIILMSTLNWLTVRAINGALAERAIGFVDAPFTGLRALAGAEVVPVKCFVGGKDSDLSRAEPILTAMKCEITHWGDAGQGTAFKIIHSLIAQANRIVAAEAFALGAKAGLDPRKMLDVLSQGNANSPAMQQLASRAISKNFVGVPLDVTIADVDLQIRLGRALGIPLMMTSQARNVYDIARAMGFSQEDGAAVIKVYQSWAGGETA